MGERARYVTIRVRILGKSLRPFFVITCEITVMRYGDSTEVHFL